MNKPFKVSGQFVDIAGRRIYGAEVEIENGKIKSVTDCPNAPRQYIMPGFTDAHIHIESSMLTPPYFAESALPHGTVATISDPHEIANVCGVKGVEFMLESAAGVPLKFHFGAPSCVPATRFETAGAELNSHETENLLSRPDIYYLSEVMNFPAVISREPEMIKKLEAAKKFGKPIDGHAPGMRFPQTKEYFGAGITTDHECFTAAEARDKLAENCKILIREGSAAKNYEALKELFETDAPLLMFCSDDLHPDDLVKGHINLLVARAVKDGFDLFDILYAACVHPVLHYNMKVGLLRQNDDADFIIVRDLVGFEVISTYINGSEVVREGRSLYRPGFSRVINRFSITGFDPSELKITADGSKTEQNCRVIEALDGQLITNMLTEKMKVRNGEIISDPERDILKIAVVNRYAKAPASVCLIRNFGLKGAAIASTVAHDSHNIVAVGSDDQYITEAILALIKAKGGIAYADADHTDVLPLEVAGLMTNSDAAVTAAAYQRLTRKARSKGCLLNAPYMTLSFMALPVIPRLKITDLGLFDTEIFNFAPLSADG